MEISNEVIEQLYHIAKRIYDDKEITRKEGLKELFDNYGMNKNSATSYIAFYHTLRTGRLYKRSIKEYAISYFLENIRNDFGDEAYQTAQKSVNMYWEYYYNKNDDDSFNYSPVEPTTNIYNEYNDEEEELFNEGKAVKTIINKYERDPEARKKCIEHYGYKCHVCGLLLSDIYGEIAKDFIHIHHIIPLSSIKEEYIVDPINDMRPLCPNCHSIIHRKSPASSIEELIELIKKTTAIRGGG
jgi:5-methylcytosine-specific restriction protein A